MQVNKLTRAALSGLRAQSKDRRSLFKALSVLSVVEVSKRCQFDELKS
jgi:hypothetical protein